MILHFLSIFFVSVPFSLDIALTSPWSRKRITRLIDDRFSSVTFNFIEFLLHAKFHFEVRDHLEIRRRRVRESMPYILPIESEMVVRRWWEINWILTHTINVVIPQAATVCNGTAKRRNLRKNDFIRKKLCINETSGRNAVVVSIDGTRSQIPMHLRLLLLLPSSTRQRRIWYAAAIRIAHSELNDPGHWSNWAICNTLLTPIHMK